MVKKLIRERFPIEIRRESLIHSAKRAFENGISYASIIQRFATSVYPNLMQRIEALELSESSGLLPILFIQAKRTYFETKEWIDLNLEVYKQVSNQGQFKEEKEIAELLFRQLQRIECHASKIYELAHRSFPTQYSEQLGRIEAELDRVLIGNPDKLAIYTKEQKGIYFEKIKTSKKELREMADWVIQERPNWFKLIMEDARGFYLPIPGRSPYPVLYTIRNSVYIPLETPEHFLGIGEGKIICRTIDLDQGKILALVKPRTLYSLHVETEKALAKQEDIFDFALRESNFLMQLQGKKGIIQVFEWAVFKMNKKQHLFLIEEKYDSNLIRHVFSTDPSKVELGFRAKVNIARCIFQGLINIHNANMIHRDIKPHNILLDLSDPDHTHAVICDFNLACYTDERKKLEEAGFAPMGCPPEYVQALFSRNKHTLAKATTQKMDIWAMGVVLWFIFFTDRPLPWLQAEDEAAMLIYLARLPLDWFPKELEDRPFALLIKKMFSINPNQRPTAVEAYEEFELLGAHHLKD
jgi:serine/threonine protein kinase